MMLADICVNSLRCELNEVWAAPISRPRTSAAIVAISPVPSLTMSFESALKWSSGRAFRSNIPSTAPAKTQTNTVQLMAVALQRIFRLLRLSRGHLAVSSWAQDAEQKTDAQPSQSRLPKRTKTVRHPAVVSDTTRKPQLL